MDISADAIYLRLYQLMPGWLYIIRIVLIVDPGELALGKLKRDIFWYGFGYLGREG